MRVFLISWMTMCVAYAAAPKAESVRMPLLFEPNLGQVESSAPFVAHSQSLTMALDGAGATIAGKT